MSGTNNVLVIRNTAMRARYYRALMSNNESFKTNKTCDLLLAAALTLEDSLTLRDHIHPTMPYDPQKHHRRSIRLKG
jgi:hypothetical protein